MKKVVSGISLLLFIQGIGGFINRLTNGASSWFLVNYIDALNGYEIIANIGLIILGAIVGAASLKMKDRVH